MSTKFSKTLIPCLVRSNQNLLRFNFTPLYNYNTSQVVVANFSQQSIVSSENNGDYVVKWLYKIVTFGK